MPVNAVSVPPAIAQALTSAGNRSGVDFDYLLTTAMRESSLNPDAKARTSSATGLFQFLNDTWLETVKEEGPRLGYGDIAKHITKTGDHTYTVADAAMRKQILAMRRDPEMASDMAAAFTRRNGEYLANSFGRQPSPGELYIAHFLGARGAEKFFQHGLNHPDEKAAKFFPRQAKANPAIFYNDGKARSVRDVYQVLTRKHQALEVNSTVLTVQQLAADQSVGASPAKDQASQQPSPTEVILAYAKQGEPVPRILQTTRVLPGQFAAPPGGDAFSLYSAMENVTQMAPLGRQPVSGMVDFRPAPKPRVLMSNPPAKSGAAVKKTDD